jgi:hypothetical protein
MARFVGKLDFSGLDPENPKADRVLQQNFGFVRDDGLMVLLLEGGKVNGASIPEIFWIPLGHPLEDENAFWSSPHDGGYRRFALIIDLNAAEVTPEYALDNWYNIPVECFVHRDNLSRKWWDKTMVACMKVMGEPRWKQKAVYWGVRIGGWRSYRKHRGKREVHG